LFNSAFIWAIRGILVERSVQYEADQAQYSTWIEFGGKIEGKKV